MITKLKERILAGGAVSREEALRLACEADLEPLCRAADDIRRQMCGNPVRPLRDHQRKVRALLGGLQILRAVGPLPGGGGELPAARRGTDRPAGAVRLPNGAYCAFRS